MPDTLPRPPAPVDQPRPDDDFVLALLAELRASDYRSVGWARFLARSWRQARASAGAHPALVASWRRTALALALLEAAALGGEAAQGDAEGALRALPGTALGLAYAQFDAYVHLGLNAATRGEPLFDTLGAPTALTLARSTISALLWGHLAGGRPLAPALATAALLLACATDIADGGIARATGRVTRLGRYLDGEADLALWLGLALTGAARGRLPRWLLGVLLARWASPLPFGFARYFAGVERIDFGSTLAGKAAGVAQALTIAEALRPPLPPASERWIAPARVALHVATATLLVAAPLSQLYRLWRASK